MRSVLFLAALALATGAIAGEPAYKLPCAWTDKACALDAARKHRVHLAETWADAYKLPVERRFGPAPDVLVEALALDNIANGFPEKPRAARPSEGFMADVRAAIDELPAAVKRIIGPELAGIYFVEQLGGTGFTNRIRDAQGPVGAFIALDVAVLEKFRANDWATWKESSPFRPDGAFALRARIEEPHADNRRNAIQYILLHELGHVLSVRAKVHPDWTIRPKDAPPATEYPFFRLSWRIDRERDRFESVFDPDFPLRKDVAYYVGAKIAAKDMAAAYDQLEKTNFPTLYAATHPGDDFAEAFASYVHVVLMKKPFAVEILERGRVVKVYLPCWEEARCAAKRRILERLLGES
jgi:hypothetical protein